MRIEKIHHVAYRCRDAKETVEWYGKNLGMDFKLAIAEDFVPSTHEPDPYMHVFLDAGDTLLRAEPPVEHVYREAFARHGVAVEEEAVHAAAHATWRDVATARERGEERLGSPGVDDPNLSAFADRLRHNSTASTRETRRQTSHRCCA